MTPQKRAYGIAYRVSHREQLRATNLAYREAHREEMYAKNRAWRLDHLEENRAYQRGYMVAHYKAQARIETYVIYAGGSVIYVGRTDHFGPRLNNHKLRSPWLGEMTDIHHRYHATYGDSLVDEALLIRLHQPKYNQLGVTR